MRVYCFTLHLGEGVEHLMPWTLSSITIGHGENPVEVGFILILFYFII